MKLILYTGLSGLWVRIRKKFNKNSLIFLFFLFISSLFWLLNELNKDAVSDIKFPVRYLNLIDDKVLVNDLPSILIIRIQASGYTLLKYKLSTKLVPLTLDMKSYVFRQKKNSSEFFLLTSDLHGRFERRFSDEMKILEILPDTLNFRFDEMVHKKLPVIPNISYSLARQYLLIDKISTYPDSIVVSGPASILDTLKGISTVYKSYNDLKSSVSEQVDLTTPPKVLFSHEQVELSIPVEQFTEASFKVPIRAGNLPDSLILRTFPNQVTLTCVSGLGTYDNISSDLFWVEVDYESIQSTTGNKLKVHVESYPEFVQSVRIHPTYVDFIIEKK